MKKISEESLKKLYDINWHIDDLSNDFGTENKFQAAEIVLKNIRSLFEENELSLPDIYSDLIEDLERRSNGDFTFLFKQKVEETYFDKIFTQYHSAVAIEYFILSGMRVDDACKRVAKVITNKNIKQIGTNANTNEKAYWETVKRWRADIRCKKYDKDPANDFIPSYEIKSQFNFFKPKKWKTFLSSKKRNNYKVLAEKELQKILEYLK